MLSAQCAHYCLPCSGLIYMDAYVACVFRACFRWPGLHIQKFQPFTDRCVALLVFVSVMLKCHIANYKPNDKLPEWFWPIWFYCFVDVTVTVTTAQGN